jgi:hypothetical protein
VEVYHHSLFTSIIDGDKWSASQPGCLTPREEPPTPMERKAEWDPEPVWQFWSREKILLMLGLEPRTVQFGFIIYIYIYIYIYIFFTGNR